MIVTLWDGYRWFTMDDIFQIQEISGVDTLYRDQTFGDYTGVGFEIAKIEIHQEPTAVSGSEVHYNMELTGGAVWGTTDLLRVSINETLIQGSKCTNLVSTE